MADEWLVEEFGSVTLASGLSHDHLAEDLLARCRQALTSVSDLGVSTRHHLELEIQIWALVYGISAGAEGSMADWIAQFLPKPLTPGDLPAIKWRHSLMAGMSDLDEDAPLRSGTPLDTRDSEEDSAVFEYVFALLLRGETSVAADVCAQTGNWLVRAAIEATSLRTTNPVLTDTCRAASESSISAAERGVYGLLGKRLDSVAPLCQSWDELLLAYIRTGTPLEQFEETTRTDPALALISTDFRRRIVIALAKGTFPQVATELLGDMAALDDISLVRIVLHVQMVLGCVTEPAVKLYVLHLCSEPSKRAQRLPYVPCYVKELAASEQPALYGQLLAELVSPRQLLQQVELSRELGIDLSACLVQAMKLCLDLYVENVRDEVAGMRLVQCVATVLQARLYAQAVHDLVRAYELFLTHSDVLAALSLCSVYDLEDLRRDTLSESAPRGRSPDVLRGLVLLRQYETVTAALELLEKRDFSPDSAAETTQTVFAALQFDGPESLRRTCIPRLVFRLLAFIEEAGRQGNFSKDVSRLVTVLADEQRELYKYFDAQLMHTLVGPYLLAYDTRTEVL